MHFFADNARVLDEAAALKANDFDTFKKLIVESGYSSYMYLQNVFSASHPQQGCVDCPGACPAPVGKSAAVLTVYTAAVLPAPCRPFVPVDYLPEFVKAMEAVTGEGATTCASAR